MPDIAAVTEAPEIASPETTEVVETVESTPVESPAGEQESTAADSSTPEAKEDGRQFAGKLRDHYKELMASNDPNKVGLAKSLKDLFFQNKALRDKFPGGIKEVEERIAAFDKFGAPEELATLQADAKILEDIDNKWQAADPSFIDELASLNADSFKKLMPVGLNKFSQVDPEGYQRVMSGILSTTLTQAKLGDQLYLINYALSKGDADEAKRLVQGISQWMQGLEESAKSVPAPADNKNPELDQRAAALEEREAEIFNRSLASDYNGWRDSQISSTLNKLTNGRKIDPERMEIFQDRVIRELVKMHPADFQDNWQRLYSKGDKDALLKYVKSQDGANISKAVSKVHALLFPSNGVKKAPVTTPAPTPNAKPAEAGWVKIASRPNPQEIDRGRGRTTDEMIFSGKAILRSGKKVMWDRA